MTIFSRWFRRPDILATETPKGPWGGSGDDGNSGPRNPWAQPPGGRKPAAKPTALDEFLRKARGSGGGGGGNGGFGGLPSGANARALWAIGVAIIAVVWILFTSVHQIGPQQRGVVTYFGKYAGTLDPGVRLTMPAPISDVTVVDVQKIRTDNFPTGDGENLTLTGDQNIIDLAYSVRWDISDPRDYVFQLAEPNETVRAAAESAMRAVVATTTLDQAIGTGRTVIEQRVADLTQQILNDYKSGVRIQGVAIKQAAAPARIVEDFNAVTAAQQEAIANLNQSRSYAQQVVARAQGEAASFDKVYEQYKLAPEVTRRRMYYETMEAVLAKSDKTIVETPGGVVPYLPLSNAKRLPNPEVVTPAPAAAAAAPQAQPGAAQ
ncbi:protease FtsH subunit HflK [Sphingomonas sp. PP-CE-3A-406]|uniref:protease modulator HflK n=1 Tax=unclassified Sphingomonas TaxID=196159 RepID=UPI000EF9FC05|nr:MULTISPECIES: protease modulator HflK [unclassified Sphingomonas]RMB54266.1 protease FtsH subunit HflK [Sphingomonas sp. PP-CE-3A-406]TCP71293.1 protease FtsH subunit HflK [Sphingomonas sp. PP-CE-1G-424]